MKSILICPGYRFEVAKLAESAPLATLPLLGESLLAFWLGHLAARGATEITILACDRPGAVRAAIGNGARWGLRLKVIAEIHELSPEDARARHREGDGWLPAPDDAVLIDHLPGLPGQPMCGSYAAWFAAAQAWLDRAVTPDRVGVKEIRPGIRVGWRSRIPADAVLVAPCWIGEKVRLGPGVTLGPHAIIEDRAVIEAGATVVRSVVGPETLVGGQTEITDSFASGDLLVNWRDGSCLHVGDEFLLCPLRQPPGDATEWFRRVTQALTGSTPPMLPADHVTLPHA